MEVTNQENTKIKTILFTTLKNMANAVIKKQEPKELSEEDQLRIQLDDALEDLSIAESNFDNALPEFIDIANDDLTVAHNKINVIIRKLKKIESEKKF